ncbi:MAG: HDIG domain-containing protein [Lachnospiraceae bacterium]|nr:HDIG domain-containing protein [Lachnospiraceae bacterium]
MMFPIELNHDIKAGVLKTLPMINDIKDEELRRRVVDAWTFSLQANGYAKIEEMPGSGMPEAEGLGDQSMHLIVVTLTAMSIYDNLEKAYKMDLGLDRDILLACAICHDIGKPYEYNPENRARWAIEYKKTGKPNLRHPAYGAYIALTAELPEEVVHVCANHSPEGRFVTRSAYGTIVHYADDGSWFSLASLLDLNIPKL